MGDYGHHFEISVRMRGEGTDWTTELVTQEVRAYSLNEALRRAGELPLSAWLPEDGE
jgi:hypothetical protein